MVEKIMKDARAMFMASQLGVHAPSTLKFYGNRLKILDPLNEKCVHEVTPDDLTLIWADLVNRHVLFADHPRRQAEEGTLSPHTLHSFVRAVRTFFNWCVDRRYCEISPAKALKKPFLPIKEPKYLTAEDLDLILDEAYEDERDYAIVCFLADTASRVGGVAGLTVKNLDLEHKRAIVQEKGRGGYGKTRTVFLKERCVNALKRRLAVRDSDCEFVFCWREGGLKPEGIYRVVQRLAEKAGVEGYWNPHAFRHGYARAALDKGANLRTVSRQLGHSGIQVTVDIYLAWDEGEDEEDHEEFSWLPDDDRDVANLHDAEQQEEHGENDRNIEHA